MGLSRVLARRLANYDDPHSLGSRLRARRVGHLLDLLAQAHAQHGKVDVIDIGGTRNYWLVLPEGTLDQYDVRVTVVNLPGTPHPEDDDRFTFVEGDGCALRYTDGEFHVAHANSVLEHVGDWSRMVAFAGEVRRVAAGYVAQTPYFWFPIEPHFMAPLFHWLPESWRVRLLMRLPLGHGGRRSSLDEAIRAVQSARLVDLAQFRTLFPDATVHVERIAGLPKSLMAVRPVS
jgi:hypothetical protein